MASSWKRRHFFVAGLLAAVLVVLVASTQVCLTAWLKYGVALGRCPDGDIRQTVEVEALSVTRGAEGSVRVRAIGHYTLGPSDRAMTVALERFEPSLLLVSAGQQTPLVPEKGWTDDGAGKLASVVLPKVPDGEYVLRARVKSSLGESSHDLPLPLFAPARVHVITDRPLYEPGNTVKFRAVGLRARDLAPLDGRPGTWMVMDPSGEVLLEELAPAGEWGVVSGSFPLDRGAATGNWTVRWSSGGASGDSSFRVQPFTLPRFRVEAEPAKPFYGRHERPVLRGVVRYSSGAPVPKAALSIDWSVAGEWPPPTSWLEGALPKNAEAGANGRFTLELPPVPEDLQGQATLSARIAATDPSGDRVEGGASVLLSEDPIQVSAVTELGEGLVQGFNNRLYLRATTADGRVLEGAHLTVKRAWEPKDPGVNAKADEDGVASLQLDPGPPVNVVIPPAPFRPPPREPAVERGEAIDLFSDEEPPLADQVAMEKWDAALEPCARWVQNGFDELVVGVRVGAGGAVTAVAAPANRLGKCVATALSARSLPPGRERLYSVGLGFRDDELPKLHAEVDGLPLTQAVGDPPEAIAQALRDAIQGLRDCIPPAAPSAGALPRILEWRLRAGSKEISIGWVRAKNAEPFPASALDCMQARLSRVPLADPAPEDGLGVARLSVQAPEKYEAMRPQATTMLGYDFVVTARRGDELLGTTRLRMAPGAVPPVRLRATPVIASPGDAITVDILRGPDFSGELPEKLFLSFGHQSLEAKVEEKTRSAQFQLPAGAEGWMEVSWGGARAVVFVRPKAQLWLSVRPDRERYAPGQLAHLAVETRASGAGTPAAVGLFGIDESLGQLVALPGPDALEQLRPLPTATAAFGSLDAQALTMGRVRGASAAAATVVRVTAIPAPEQLEVPVHARGGGSFDPLIELTDHFYSVLAELHVQTRAWEAGAPEAEKMTPKTMASLWEKALDASAGRKEPVTDAFGRRLKLSQLPSDLLALTDPRMVVVHGTRLPEDVENWSNWVARETP
ncbi:MAG: hypothetical protein HYZ28_10720 [Myxococcales bacterium]|nr:hypothetical protein [Myxococcales bacterium]